MNITFSLEQTSGAGKLDANLILRQYKLDLMPRFKGIKSINPKMKEKEIAKEPGYRYDTKMQNPHNSNNPKRPLKTSNDLKRPQMISKNANENDNTVSKKVKTKNSLGGGALNINPT